MRAPVTFLFAAAAVVVGGCGLSDEKVTFDLRLRFDLSTSDAEWRAPPPSGVPTWVCAGRAALVTDCCHTPSGEAFDCGQYPLRCDVDGFCALAFEHHSTQTVVLDATPQLSAFRGKTMTQATLPEFTVIADNAALPVRTMDVYVGPARTGFNEADAVQLTSFVPPIDLSEVRAPLSAEARSSLSGFLVDAHSPFNLTLVSHVVFERGQGAAVGAMSVSLVGRVEAHY